MRAHRPSEEGYRPYLVPKQEVTRVRLFLAVPIFHPRRFVLDVVNLSHIHPAIHNQVTFFPCLISRVVVVSATKESDCERKRRPDNEIAHYGAHRIINEMGG